MMEDSLKDTDILGKTVGSEIKGFLKENNSTYSAKLKEKISEGFRGYFDSLNSKIEDESHMQEQSQKNIHDQIDKLNASISSSNTQIARHQVLISRIVNKKHDTIQKAKALRLIRDNYLNEKHTQKLETQILYVYISKLKRNLFKLLQKYTLHKPIKVIEEDIKSKTEEDLKKYETMENKEREELIKLIYQAEERLKHENRKKIQTKLLLDQMVLKGVSAMNMQALTLSNEALKGNNKNIKL